MVTRSLLRVETAALLFVLAAVSMVTADSAVGRLSGSVRTYKVSGGDTWRSLGSRVGVDPQIIAAENSLSVSAPLNAGQALRIDNRHIVPEAVMRGRIVVNLPQRMLFYANDDGEVTAFPVAVGRRTWQTPVEPFTIISRQRDPSWEVPDSIREEAARKGETLPEVVPPGPKNPLGKYWLGLSIGSVGIHGTNAPSSIYRVTTHGCIRVHPDDIEWLFDHVEVGVPGELIYEPVLLAVVGDDVYLEAHPDAYGKAGADPKQALRDRAEALGISDQINWVAAAQVLQRRAGVARRITAGAGRASSPRSMNAEPN